MIHVKTVNLIVLSLGIQVKEYSMDRRKLITLTLFLSTLTLYPVAANTEKIVGEGITVSFAAFEQDSFQERIASYLEQRGLEEDAATRISQALVGEEEALFDQKARNLLSHCPQLHEEELVAYLADEALHQNSVALDRYGQLVSMMTKIKKRALDTEVLKRLSYVAKINRTIYG
jgi:hypothetical protein